jgi:hypothetical protein
MSSIIEQLSGVFTDDKIRQISQQIGADEHQTRAAMGAALPAFVEMLSRKAQDPQHVDQLHNSLSSMSGIGDISSLERERGVGRSSNAPARAPSGFPSGAGDLLGGLFGDKQGRVESGVGKMSGLDASAVKNLMMMLAPLVIGMVAKQAMAKKLDKGGLTGFLRKEKESMTKASPQGTSLIGRLLDQDGDGDFDLNDVLKLGMNWLLRGKNR